MKKIITLLNFRIFLFVFLLILFGKENTYAEDVYPVQVSIVNKSDAKYDSPENAYTASISSLMNKDISWYYSSMTVISAEKKRNLYEKYNFNIEKKYKAVEDIKNIYILEKFEYQAGIVLVIEIENEDGSKLKGPSLFVQEDGSWKSHPNIPNDDPILDLIEYTPPPQHLTPFNALMYPSQWPLPWYSWIAERIEQNSWAERLADNMTLLCVISDQEEDD